MKYKTEILTRVDGLKNQMDYLLRQVENGTANGPEAVKTLKELLKRIDSIEQLIEAE
jgi:hypothetical protein